MGFPHGHRKTTTLVAGLRMTGMVAPMVLDGPINGDWFEAYVAQVLVPELVDGFVSLARTPEERQLVGDLLTRITIYDLKVEGEKVRRRGNSSFETVVKVTAHELLHFSSWKRAVSGHVATRADKSSAVELVISRKSLVSSD
ncbi:hypothetical protein KY084_12870 [Stakelama sp. CBK3Z-3]|uniref:Uncharacterized protein n=1 Tax=Stakelama flava TaxID=2860338 RepID=A0ABS6XNP2_9SPHN|nr:hypothetical protein [Stakelama flava]